MGTRATSIGFSGADVRKRRVRLGLTQAGLAEALGVTVTTVARWERGERSVSTPLLVRLALDHLEGCSAVRPILQPIPVDGVRLVGRSRELAAATRLIDAGGARLVTFAGAGGVGKSVLGLEVARRAALGRVDGGCFVELVDLPPDSAVEESVGRALGVRVAKDGSVADAVIRALAGVDLVLVLDNCEHVRASAAGVVDQILRRCPRVTIVATSREPLRLRAERRIRVDPLPVPDLTRLPPPGSLLRVPAVTLFVERWRMIQPEFRLTAVEAGVVAELCVRLDGLPLALELAAASGHARSVSELLSQLTDGVGRPDELVAVTLVDLPPRHRSLDAVLDWSYRLLDPVTQVVFRRLAIFVGSFELSTAAAMAGDDLDPELVRRGLDHLVRLNLITLSRVVVTPSGVGPSRFRLLETVRAFASGLLAQAAEHGLVANRHARWCADWAQANTGRFENAEQTQWLDELDVEFGNVRAALDWCLSPEGDPPTGLRLASAVRRYWDMRGLEAEAEATLRAFIGRADDPCSARMDALIVLAGIATRAENAAAVETYAVAAEQIAIGLDDGSGRARAMAALTYPAFMRGDSQDAARRAMLAVVVAEQSGDRVAVDHARLASGVAALGRGDLAAAIGWFGQVSTAARARGDAWLLSECHDVLAGVLLILGEFQAARSAALESFEARLVLRNRPNIPLNLRLIGIADAGLADSERAAVLFGAAVAVEHALGVVPNSRWSDGYRQTVELVQTRLGERRFKQLLAAGKSASDADIRQVAAGRPSKVFDKAKVVDRGHANHQVLTGRELEIARLLAEGLTNRGIAARLGISERTVGSHLEHTMTKLGVHSRAQVVATIGP